MTVEEKLAAALAELGDTADKVADRLRALEIKGRRQTICNCPIANYLASRGFDTPAAGLDFILVGGIQFLTPSPIAAFIERFDKGVYLDLVETA